MKQYDYLIVGAGLFGTTFAFKAKQDGKRCLVIDKRPHLGGNIYCDKIEGINVHKYGAHIFHTSDKEIWDFVNSIIKFNHYINSPIANYKGKLYNLPFNMNTFYALWGVHTPDEAKKIIDTQRKEAGITEPQNLEEQAIALVGKDIYNILVKEYTEKQWGRKCCDLPAFIIKRLPVRFTFNNNYFDDSYQGIPIGGYNKLIDGLLNNIETRNNIDFFNDRYYWENISDKIVFTGMIDQYYEYQLGRLEYRTVTFEDEIINSFNYQGVAVMNFTDLSTPYTRIIEHKHFEFGTQDKTVISKEYSSEWEKESEPYYPINDRKNSLLYQEYKKMGDKETNVLFGGRLGEYKYYNMDQIIKQAQICYDQIIS
jgi:UDP-galactopyranose mutase